MSERPHYTAQGAEFVQIGVGGDGFFNAHSQGLYFPGRKGGRCFAA